MSHQSEQLLPCPFCGSPASWFKNGRSIGIECSAQMQEEGCPGCATTNVYDKDQREAVIHQWNRRAVASVKREPQWLPIESAPEGILVVVCWRDESDVEHPERHDFDFLEDGVWIEWSNHHEWAYCVAHSGSQMPQERPPYTGYMLLPPVTATTASKGDGE